MNSICGVDCTKCGLINTCNGCASTNGHPFGGECIIATCCNFNGHKHCSNCVTVPCNLKKKLIDEFNSLNIEDMDTVTGLNALKGSFVNLEYTFPSGQVCKLLDDNKIYLGNQVAKKDSTRCYGLAADENYILVCEYDANGTNPEIIIYKRRD